MAKKIWSFLLGTLLFMYTFSGCQSSNMTDSASTESIAFTEEELSRETKLVVDPTVTGAITVRYYFAVLEDPNFMFNAAETVFREYYPNVEITLEPVNFLFCTKEEYGTKLATELMAGNGPDVFFQNIEGEKPVVDPYKMMRAGAFLDLTDYFRADDTYNPSDFNQIVLQAGQFEGRQYLVPAYYSIPLFMTTEKIADQVGFHPENCTDFNSILEEMIPIIEQNPLDFSSRGLIYMCDTILYPPLFTGCHWVNHEDNAVQVDTPEMQKLYELTKGHLLQCTNGRYQIDLMKEIGGSTLYSTALTNPSAYFADLNRGSYGLIFANMQLIEQAGDTPILLPWRTFDGKIEAYTEHFAGVNRNTKNPQAAYRFIRTWLSQEYLMKEGAWGTDSGIPLNSIALDMYLQRAQEPTYIYHSEMGGEGKVVELKGLSQESADKYLALLDEIDYCTIVNPTFYIMRETMEDYYSGARSYESCISEVQSKLEIYLTE